jgi:hypothetical protein
MRAPALVTIGRTILAKGPLGTPAPGKLKEHLLRKSSTLAKPPERLRSASATPPWLA